MRLTACDCAAAGWCQRHGCWKPEPLFQQCRRNTVLFDAWEAGCGPCLGSETEHGSDQVKSSGPDGPSLGRRALNFGTALVRHTTDGLRRVEQATYDARLAICTQCPSCDLERLVCLQPTCGCQLTTKAWWASEQCPLGKWPEADHTESKLPERASPVT